MEFILTISAKQFFYSVTFSITVYHASFKLLAIESNSIRQINHHNSHYVYNIMTGLYINLQILQIESP